MQVAGQQSSSTQNGDDRGRDRERHAHTVQFYDDDVFLTTSVAQFLADGLGVGQPGLAIATPAHREGFGSCLRERGVDLNSELDSGRLTLLDARDTLDDFMSGRLPDPTRFRDVVGGVIERSARSGSAKPVRAYGELVDLLWKDGNSDGAMQVEEMWNDLAQHHAFSLLCGYSMSSFGSSTDMRGFEDVCRTHTHVVPTEIYLVGDEPSRLRQIALLQQRARALETELEYRRELEQRLETALERERDARIEAEIANQAKSEFLAVMSHELRTPLNAIGGHAQLLEIGIHGPVSPAQKAALARIDRSQRHLLTLINDLLNLSQIESGRVQYEISDVLLAPLLDEVTSMIEPMLTDAGIRHHVAHAPEKLTVRADAEKLQQIVLNLLTNAIKFTPSNGRIALETELSRDAVLIHVRDSGIGIDPSKLERVFEPFVQMERRVTNGQPGVGLGLAISRDLARGMGGDLTATSTVGRGTTFTLRLLAV